MPTLFPDHACLRLTIRQSEPSIAGMVRSGKDAFQPRPEHHFTFGLWTVGNPGRDPFGDPVRASLPPAVIVRKLAELGAYGVNLHDNDLVPSGASAAERDKIVREFKQVLADTGMKVPMATTNLFSDPAFRDGAFTSSDSRVRAYALQKTLAAIDLAVELGASTYVCWGGREGVETNAAKDPRTALGWYRDAINYLCEYVLSQRYDLRFALEAKPNEPRGDIFLPTTGHMLAFIYTLDHPEMVGLNPEVAHEQMAGLNFVQGVAQALEAGKLFNIDLNDQKGPRYDQDLRFGSESLKPLFFLVKLLQDSAYTTPRNIDAHAYPTEDEQGVWEFALGCMRTYNMLKAKVKRFNADSEIRAALESLNGGDQTYGGLLNGYSTETVQKLQTKTFDFDTLAQRGYGYERLDQLTIEIILGVR